MLLATPSRGGYDGLRKTWPLSGGSRGICERIAGDVGRV